MTAPTLRGTCRVLHCLDVARRIDLARAEESLRDVQRTRFHHKARLPDAGGRAVSLRLTWDTPGFQADGLDVTGGVEIAVYGSGALCVTWSLPFDGGPPALVELSSALYDNASLAARSREVGAELVAALGAACREVEAQWLIEDYVVFDVRDAPAGGARALLGPGAEDLARILRAERGPLSAQEVADALASAVSYGPGDLAVVDWLGALLVGEDTLDERRVLELANVELLELRLLDRRLDGEVEAAYALLARPRALPRVLLARNRELEDVARMQADAAVLHEGIDNPLKFLGDDYLARLYRVAATRFHLQDWDESIQRKLGVLRNVYQSLVDLTSSRRSEMLEWIIILLIATDIVLYFTPWR